MTSPLIATFGVLAALGVLAVPLKQLTSREGPQALAVRPEEEARDSTSAWVQVKWLASVVSIQVASTDGQVLWETAEAEPGQANFIAAVPILDGDLELLLSVEFLDEQESAVFVSVAPDHLKVQSAYLLGLGDVTGVMSFDWPQLRAVHEP